MPPPPKIHAPVSEVRLQGSHVSLTRLNMPWGKHRGGVRWEGTRASLQEKSNRVRATVTRLQIQCTYMVFIGLLVKRFQPHIPLIHTGDDMCPFLPYSIIFMGRAEREWEHLFHVHTDVCVCVLCSHSYSSQWGFGAHITWGWVTKPSGRDRHRESSQHRLH